MPGRNKQSEEYRYGFNGAERDDEVSGGGNSYTTEFRQYSPRLGRWLSIDPLGGIRPYESVYAGFGNNPIYYVDPSGLTPTNGDSGGDEPPRKLKMFSKKEKNKTYKWLKKIYRQGGDDKKGDISKELMRQWLGIATPTTTLTRAQRKQLKESMKAWWKKSNSSEGWLTKLGNGISNIGKALDNVIERVRGSRFNHEGGIVLTSEGEDMIGDINDAVYSNSPWEEMDFTVFNSIGYLRTGMKLYGSIRKLDPKSPIAAKVRDGLAAAIKTYKFKESEIIDLLEEYGITEFNDVLKDNEPVLSKTTSVSNDTIIRFHLLNIHYSKNGQWTFSSFYQDTTVDKSQIKNVPTKVKNVINQ